MRGQIRRSTKQYLMVVILSLLVVGTAFIVAYIGMSRHLKETYGAQLGEVSRQITNAKTYVYETNREIEAGEYLNSSALLYHEVMTQEGNGGFITKEDIGKTTLITIPKGTYVRKGMVANGNLTDKEREVEYSCVRLSSNLQVQDTVDIRLFFPNGEDYVLLSKKKIKGMSEDRLSSYFWLREEEILFMSSAMVDAYLYEGAHLYATKYVEPLVQEAAIVTYEPSLATLELIDRDPNIVETAKTELRKNVRKAMENRLADSMHLLVDQIEWDLSLNQPYQNIDKQKRKEQTNQEEKEEHRWKEQDQFLMPQTKEENLYYQNEKKAKEADIEYGE